MGGKNDNVVKMKKTTLILGASSYPQNKPHALLS